MKKVGIILDDELTKTKGLCLAVNEGKGFDLFPDLLLASEALIYEETKR